MSPQTRHGRAVPPNRKARNRADVGPAPEPVAQAPKPASQAPKPAPEAAKPAPEAAKKASQAAKPVAEAPKPAPEAPKSEVPVEPRARSFEGKRAKVSSARHKKQHGLGYRWFMAGLPIFGIMFALLGVLWVLTTVTRPPTPAQQWTSIESKWSPARESARQAIAANTLDFAKQQAAYTDFYNQTKGWVDEVTAVKDWGVGAQDVSALVSDGQSYLTVLQQVNTAKTPDDVAALADTLKQWDDAFTADLYKVHQDFKLTATPTASPLAFPSVNPTPTASPGASGSVGPSASPSPSATASPVPTVSAAPTPLVTPSPASSPS